MPFGVRTIAAIGAIGAIAGATGDGHAFPYLVRSGDTAGQIAERMYGRVELERVIVSQNGLGDWAVGSSPYGSSAAGGALVPGMPLTIPATGHHRVERGETWSSIAAVRCGAAERGEVLARENGENPWVQPAVGREILVPFNLRFVASPGDTTESVAYRFLGRRDDAWMIQSYNRLPLPTLSQGQTLLVPLVDLPLTEAGRTAAREAAAMLGAQAGGKARAAQDAAEQDIASVAGQVRRGDYIAAIAAGSGALAGGDLTAPQRARIFALLTESYAAVGEKRLAAASCAGWKKQEPSLDLDADRTSPKIRAACAQSPGAASP